MLALLAALCLYPSPRPMPPPSPMYDYLRHAAPAKSPTPTLDRLPPWQRTALADEAHNARRFPDGSIWVRSPELARKNLAADFMAPLPKEWFCPSTGEEADSETEIFDRIDAKRSKAQNLATGAKTWDGIVIQVLEGGIVVVVTGEVDPVNRVIYVTGFPLKDKVVDRQSIGLTVRENGRFQYKSADGVDTIKKFEWVDLKDERIKRETSPLNAEDLARAALEGQIPRSLPRWKTERAVIPQLPRDPYANEPAPAPSYGVKLVRDSEPLNFDWVDRKKGRPLSENPLPPAESARR